MNKSYKTTVLLLSGVFSLGGCDEQPDSSAKVEVSNAVAPTTAAPVNASQSTRVAESPKPYEATLEEGIDFKKPGYPVFLAEVSGVSGVESWGRWSDGSNVKFRFKNPLPKNLTIEIVANAYGPNQGLPIKVRVGNTEQTLTIVNHNPPATYSLLLKTDGKSDSLEFTVPQPTMPAELNPNNKDPRKLGLGFYALKIK